MLNNKKIEIMNKRILSFVAGVALVIGFSACEKEVEEGGLKSAQDVKKAVDVKTILATHGDCIGDFNDAGYNQAWFNSFGKKLNGSGKHNVAENIYFEKKGNETYLYFLEGAEGIVTVAYKNGNYFAFFNFDAACLAGEAIFFDGKIYSNLAWNYDDGKEAETPVIVRIGFIGYYLFEGNVLSTSPFWMPLEPGQCFDWDFVDAEYAKWMEQGGLEPDRSVWQTSGYASFTFEDGAGLCHGDFNVGQLEDYYKAYFVDPGYKLPETGPVTIPGQTGNCMLDETVLDKIGDWIGNERVTKPARGYHVVDCVDLKDEWGNVHTVYQCVDCGWITGLPPQEPGEPIVVVEGSNCPIVPVDPIDPPVTVVGLAADCAGFKIVAQGGNNVRSLTIPLVFVMSDGTTAPLYTFHSARFNFQNDNTVNYDFIVEGVSYRLRIPVRSNSVNCNNVTVRVL